MKTNIEIYFEILIFSWTVPLSSVQVEEKLGYSWSVPLSVILHEN